MNSLARKITDWLDPKTWIAVACLMVGAAGGGWAGAAWGVFLFVFSAVVPLAYIVYTVGGGDWRDRHVPNRADRVKIIPVIMLSVAVGGTVLWWGGGPHELLALTGAMLTTLLVILPITVWWKVSVHTAVSSGAIGIIAAAVSPWFLLVYPVVASIAWSRTDLKDHTTAQTIVGAVLGALVAGGAYLLMS